MPKIRFIGDVHGRYEPYKRLIKNVPYSIQVGDMGVGFKRVVGDEIKWLRNPPYDSMARGKHLFIRGNHDNPEVCAEQEFWIPDGSLIDGVFCIGGASSIDRVYRTPGLDWWPDEQISPEKFEEYIQLYSELKPDVVVSHDCPESIATGILHLRGISRGEGYNITRQSLERMYHRHQPKLWIFGHWHYSINFKDNQTRFICLNELEHIDLKI